MEHYQHLEKTDTIAAHDEIHAIYKQLREVSEKAIERNPHAEVNGAIQEFLDGLDDVYADTLQVAYNEADDALTEYDNMISDERSMSQYAQVGL